MMWNMHVVCIVVLVMVVGQCRYVLSFHPTSGCNAATRCIISRPYDTISRKQFMIQHAHRIQPESDDIERDNSQGNRSMRRFLAVALSALSLLGSGTTALPSPADAAFPFFQSANINIPPTPSKGFQTKSGLKYFDLITSDIGATPRYGQLVTIKYNMYYHPYDGDQTLQLIDSTDLDRYQEPYLIKHGNGRMIRGLDEGIHTMHLGSKRRLIIPSEIGYNAIALGPIPSDASRRRELNRILNLSELKKGDFMMDVEVVMIADDEADPGYYDDIPISPDQIRETIVKFSESKEFQKSIESLGNKDSQVIPERK